jgi:hypothetical protein
MLAVLSCSEGRAPEASSSKESTSSPNVQPAAPGALTSNDLSEPAPSNSDESATDDSTDTTSNPMRGAVSLHVEPLGDCSLGDAWFDYPIVEGGHPVTATEHGTLSEDNGLGIPGRPLHVTCEWLTMGDPYRLVLGIDAYLGEDRRTASLSPVLEASKANPSSFTFSTTDGGPAWASSDSTERCEYTLIEMDDARQSIWGRIKCPYLKYQDGTETCQITEGYFYFENCRPRML